MEPRPLPITCCLLLLAGILKTAAIFKSLLFLPLRIALLIFEVRPFISSSTSDDSVEESTPFKKRRAEDDDTRDNAKRLKPSSLASMGRVTESKKGPKSFFRRCLLFKQNRARKTEDLNNPEISDSQTDEGNERTVWETQCEEHQEFNFVPALTISRPAIEVTSIETNDERSQHTLGITKSVLSLAWRYVFSKFTLHNFGKNSFKSEIEEKSTSDLDPQPGPSSAPDIVETSEERSRPILCAKTVKKDSKYQKRFFKTETENNSLILSRESSSSNDKCAIGESTEDLSMESEVQLVKSEQNDQTTKCIAESREISQLSESPTKLYVELISLEKKPVCEPNACAFYVGSEKNRKSPNEVLTSFESNDNPERLSELEHRFDMDSGNHVLNLQEAMLSKPVLTGSACEAKETAFEIIKNGLYSNSTLEYIDDNDISNLTESEKLLEQLTIPKDQPEKQFKQEMKTNTDVQESFEPKVRTNTESEKQCAQEVNTNTEPKKYLEHKVERSTESKRRQEQVKSTEPGKIFTQNLDECINITITGVQQELEKQVEAKIKPDGEIEQVETIIETEKHSLKEQSGMKSEIELSEKHVVEFNDIEMNVVGSKSNFKFKVETSMRHNLNEICIATEKKMQCEAAFEPEVQLKHELEACSDPKVFLSPDLKACAESAVLLKQARCTKPEARLEQEPEARAEREVKLEQESKTCVTPTRLEQEPTCEFQMESETCAESKVQLESEACADPELHLEQEHKACVETEIEFETETCVEPEVQFETETCAEPEIQLEPETCAEPEVQLEQIREIRAESKVEVESVECGKNNLEQNPEAYAEPEVQLEEQSETCVKPIKLEQEPKACEFQLEFGTCAEPEVQLEQPGTYAESEVQLEEVCAESEAQLEEAFAESEFQFEPEACAETELQLEQKPKTCVDPEVQLETETCSKPEIQFEQKLETCAEPKVRVESVEYAKNKLEQNLEAYAEPDVNLESEPCALERQVETEPKAKCNKAIEANTETENKIEYEIKIFEPEQLELRLGQSMELERKLEQGVESNIEPEQLKWRVVASIENENKLDHEIQLNMEENMLPKQIAKLRITPAKQLDHKDSKEHYAQCKATANIDAEKPVNATVKTKKPLAEAETEVEKSLAEVEGVTEKQNAANAAVEIESRSWNAMEIEKSIAEAPVEAEKPMAEDTFEAEKPMAEDTLEAENAVAKAILEAENAVAEATLEGENPIEATLEAENPIEATLEAENPIEATLEAENPIEATLEVENQIEATLEAENPIEATLEAENPIEASVEAENPIAEASVEAENPIAEASVEAESPIAEATLEAESPIAEATLEAESPIAEATLEAESPIAETTLEAESPIAEATLEAESPIAGVEKLLTDATFKTGKTIEARVEVEKPIEVLVEAEQPLPNSTVETVNPMEATVEIEKPIEKACVDSENVLQLKISSELDSRMDLDIKSRNESINVLEQEKTCIESEKQLKIENNVGEAQFAFGNSISLQESNVSNNQFGINKTDLNNTSYIIIEMESSEQDEIGNIENENVNCDFDLNIDKKIDPCPSDEILKDESMLLQEQPILAGLLQQNSGIEEICSNKQSMIEDSFEEPLESSQQGNEVDFDIRFRGEIASSNAAVASDSVNETLQNQSDRDISNQVECQNKMPEITPDQPMQSNQIKIVEESENIALNSSEKSNNSLPCMLDSSKSTEITNESLSYDKEIDCMHPLSHATVIGQAFDVPARSMEASPVKATREDICEMEHMEIKDLPDVIVEDSVVPEEDNFENNPSNMLISASLEMEVTDNGDQQINESLDSSVDVASDSESLSHVPQESSHTASSASNTTVPWKHKKRNKRHKNKKR